MFFITKECNFKDSISLNSKISIKFRLFNYINAKLTTFFKKFPTLK